MNIILSVFLFFAGVFAGFMILWVIGRIPDGKMIVTEDENGSKKVILDLDIDPYYIDQKRWVRFEVVRGVEEPPQPKPPMPLPPKTRKPRTTLWSAQDKHGL
jgi:hypothetical protein